MNRSAIIDAEHRAAPGEATRGRRRPRRATDRLAVLGFELPPEAPWPPAGLDLRPPVTRQIAGSSDERDEVVQALGEARISDLLLVLDGGATPDRGTERFLHELHATDRQLALLLVAAPGRSKPARWRGWLDDIGLADVPVFDSATAARQWASQRDD